VNTAFENLVAIYRAGDPPLSDEVSVTLASTELLSILIDVLGRDSDETGVTVVEGDPQNLAVGQTVKLYLTRPRKRFGLVVDGLDDLIRSAGLEEPSIYFLRQDDYVSGEQKQIDGLRGYRAILKLVGVLSESAAYLNRADAELVFIREGKYSLPILYRRSDLTDALADAISALLEIFVGDLHRPQKLEILASAVCEMTNTARPSERFGLLLRDMDELKNKVDTGYRLFAASFSYEKIKSEIQDANIEFTNKIHKAFADIQSQMLGIPVATAIVATQMKYAEGLASQFWINTGILVGSLIFAFLTVALISNQQHTLDVLGEEIDRREKAVAQKYEQLRDLLEPAFLKLRSRLGWQRLLLRAVGAVVAGGFLATFLIYLHLLYMPPH